MNSNLEKVSSQTIACENRRNPPPKASSIAPTVDMPVDPSDDAIQAAGVLAPPDDDSDEDLFKGLDWARVPHLQKRFTQQLKGKPSWIYEYGWPVWHREKKQNYWLCCYCHMHKVSGGEYCVASSTSSAASHLGQKTRGHGFDRNGKINFQRPPATSSIVNQLQFKGVEISQEVANEMASSFSQRRFLDTVKDWVQADNQSLRVIETPSFRRMIAAANPLAEQALWRSHNTLRDHILAEYHAYIPAVAEHLRRAKSLIHVSFDNWTSTGGKRALTGICVHHLNEAGDVEDYLLGLPILHGKHCGDNIAEVVSKTLQAFSVDKQRVGYFVLDNATNNDTAMAALGDEYGFYAPHRRLRCACHILNLGAQTIIWGRDRESFENKDKNLPVTRPPTSLTFYEAC